MPDTAFPARLHILLARDAPVGLVIRRGPAKSVCTIKWDRHRDTFTPGQWLRGRIYERRSDLAPDGAHFIYFAMNGRWHSAAKGAWTAISRAPYLKAIALFPKGDCWNGGGLFTGPGRYWLNDGCGHSTAPETGEVSRDEVYCPQGGLGNECLGVYYPRLLRDGWEVTSRESRTPAGAAWPVDVDIFEKRAPNGWWLRKLAYRSVLHPTGTGCYWDEHELVCHRRSIVVPLAGWEWADVDGARLVWAEGGRVHCGTVNAPGLGESKVLADFNGMKFEAMAAPY
jgi:hypothetical protein